MRVGVLGLGLGKHYVTAFNEDENVDEIVLCDEDINRINKIPTSVNKVISAYTKLEDMLKAEKLDVAAIVTPDHFHRSHTEAVLNAGIHVLLTKPVSTNLADAKAIIRLSESLDLKLMIAHEARFRSNFAKIKEIVQQGKLGELIYIRLDHLYRKYKQFAANSWYASPESGRTAIVGSGIHEVDLIRYITGKRIESAFAVANKLGELDFPGNKTVAASFTLQDHTIAQVMLTYEAPEGVPEESISLMGTQGMIIGGKVYSGGQVIENLPTEDNSTRAGIIGCVKSFLQSIIDDTPLLVNGRDAYASLAACVAADNSVKQGETTIPESEYFN